VADETEKKRKLMKLQSFIVRLVLSSSFHQPCKVLSNHFLLARTLTAASCVKYQKQPDWGSKKHKIKKRLHISSDIMADPKIEEILAPLRAAVKEQVKPMLF